MTPECCIKCKPNNVEGRENCPAAQSCVRWRKWFREEWDKIREAAALTIENREERREKLEALRRECEKKGRKR